MNKLSAMARRSSLQKEAAAYRHNWLECAQRVRRNVGGRVQTLRD